MMLMTKNIVRKRWAAACLGAILLAAFLLLEAVPSLRPAYQSDSRDKIEQPEKVMEATGVKPGMVIGEVGAGRGYFTFWLARGVGGTGKIYANDIDRSALSYIERRYADEKVANIETVRVETFLRDHNLYILRARK
jgi:predicted methyltransferase